MISRARSARASPAQQHHGPRPHHIAKAGWKQQQRMGRIAHQSRNQAGAERNADLQRLLRRRTQDRDELHRQNRHHRPWVDGLHRLRKHLAQALVGRHHAQQSGKQQYGGQHGAPTAAGFGPGLGLGLRHAICLMAAR
jgi:hypothetical protein